MSQISSSTHPRPVVAIMTDFGLGESDVGVMKAVIVGITPDAQIIDITHDIPPQNVPSGAWILSYGYRYYPKDAVFVCVVDPGVGSSRNAIAVHAGNWYFVGPDNGLFSYIYAEQTVHAAVILSNSAYHLPQVSATFHGRDIFAPVGAHLARGVPLPELGSSVAPATLQRIDVGLPQRQGSHIDARILHTDTFGNLISSIPLSMVPDLFTSPRVRLVFPSTGGVVDRRRRFFAAGADDGQPFIFGDSSGYVGVAVQNGSAALVLGIGSGAIVTFDLTETEGV
ncbi:MAG: SAM-dependent chlorinase/fluorinase [Chloroflexota bacterium]|nr:SAM-dependent chlorinase/fluorinase [Chloroflexota bacterium]